MAVNLEGLAAAIVEDSPFMNNTLHDVGPASASGRLESVVVDAGEMAA
jgi:hypothetical protein